MARIVPSDLTRLALSGAHEPEIETLATLRDTLPDDYTVFHGVHWTRQYKGRTLYGEIDFVVLNEAGRVLCIEQKNGRLEESEGELFKDYGDERKNVGDQILRSVDSIREKFAYQVGKKPGLDIEYLVYCPDHAVKRISAAGLDRERIVDARKAGSSPPASRPSCRRARRTQAAGRTRSTRSSARPSRWCPTCTPISAPRRGPTPASPTACWRCSSNIEMEPLRLHVLATAGNGKTLVARHFFDQCVERGDRPLLLCFNRPLAERLKHLVASGGRVETWYGFCDQFLKSRGIQLDFEAMWGNPDFWVEAAKQVEEQALADTPSGDWRFDTLIVDEAQDFEGDWFEAVRLFLREGAAILWLEDPNQNVRDTDALALLDQGFVGYRSLLNYRSPELIARFIARCPSSLHLRQRPSRPRGRHRPTTTRRSAPARGPHRRAPAQPTLPTQDIAVLSCRGLESTALKDAQRVGNHTLARFTGEYDMFGNQTYSKGQILFDSVRRFKGQQAAAVVLTDVDPREKQLAQELQVLFCGLTRATVRLDLV